MSAICVAFLATYLPQSQGAPQTYFYGTANINAPFAIHNFAMDNRSVNDALPMFLNKGRAAVVAPAPTPSPPPKAPLPGAKPGTYYYSNDYLTAIIVIQ